MSKTICITDDDSEDQELLEEAILALDPGHTIIKFLNGRELISYMNACARHSLPDALIIDYSMPILTGLDVLKILCGDEKFSGMHKFIWSTSNAPSHIHECLEKGAVRYFIKPDRVDKLHIIAAEIIASCTDTNKIRPGSNLE